MQFTGSGQGNAKLIQWCKTLTDKLHAPPAPYDCILHPGNTNAWAKVVGLLCEDNDFVIVEEYTYPSAQAYTISLGIKAVPTPADAEGIAARALEDVLANWNEEERGARRPRLLVTAYFSLVGDDRWAKRTAGFTSYPSARIQPASPSPQIEEEKSTKSARNSVRIDTKVSARSCRMKNQTSSRHHHRRRRPLLLPPIPPIPT